MLETVIKICQYFDRGPLYVSKLYFRIEFSTVLGLILVPGFIYD